MENKKLIQILKKEDLSLYSVISNNIETINKEQLKDIILSIYLQLPNYITSHTILKHFYNDLIEDLETTWKEVKK